MAGSAGAGLVAGATAVAPGLLDSACSEGGSCRGRPRVRPGRPGARPTFKSFLGPAAVGMLRAARGQPRAVPAGAVLAGRHRPAVRPARSPGCSAWTWSIVIRSISSLRPIRTVTDRARARGRAIALSSAAIRSNTGPQTNRRPRYLGLTPTAPRRTPTKTRNWGRPRRTPTPTDPWLTSISGC
jgi:hypothetical protein